MNVVILAGGFGTRLAEYTEALPKPMIEIAGKPILIHILELYARQGFYDFTIALGYKADYVKRFFADRFRLSGDLEIDFSTNTMQSFNKSKSDIENCRVRLVDTGVNSLTGTRLKKLQGIIGEDPFMLTYGDGLSNIDLGKLLECHRKHGRQVTMTTVHPPARFGEVIIGDQCEVEIFEEKPQLNLGWINGGFFVVEPEFLELIPSENCMLEREPLALVTRNRQLTAYQHTGFWQCMDTKRDYDLLCSLAIQDPPPWHVS